MERKLKAEPRDGTGKGIARRLRAEGRVPAVVYGHGMKPLNVSVDSRELFHLLHTEAGENVLVDLHVDHDQFLAMAREVQRDHTRGQFIHVDFLQIARDEKITVEVPVHIVGESRGVPEGRVIEHHLWEPDAQCTPQQVPTAIEANVSNLGTNESLKVTPLAVPVKLIRLTPH